MIGLLAFIWPFAEIYSWYLFVDSYSFLDAVGVVLTGGLLGLFVMMVHGRATLHQLQNTLSAGQSPDYKVLHRGIIMFGGLLIFLPGILSKFLGVLCILPGSRHLFLWILIQKIKLSLIRNKAFFVFQAGKTWTKYQAPPKSNIERDVIEVEPTTIEHKKIDS